MVDRRFSRRLVLRGLGLSGAVVLTYPSAAQTLVNQTASGADPSTYTLFDKQQADTLVTLVELVLPETDSPGGVELGVPAFVDAQLLACHSQGEQSAAAELLEQLATESFAASRPEQQQALLAALERGDAPFDAIRRDRFRALKQLMVFGYFTTRTGAMEVLAYQAIPGSYRGSIDYRSIGKTWGSLAFY